jgi:hypothetical protein
MRGLTFGEEVALGYFAYDHLPLEKQAISKMFHDQATQLMETLPPHPERVRVLRRLVEAKDIAVRCTLPLPKKRGTGV